VKFSLVTNATLWDGPRVREVLPHWLRVFGDRLSELVVALDLVPPTGRIAELHEPSRSSHEDVHATLAALASNDDRIRVVEMPDADSLRWLTARWFRSGHPVRCQGGTPILAMLFAIGLAREPLVLRTDCDVLFHDEGWLDEALKNVDNQTVDLARPAAPGGSSAWGRQVSTRALVLKPQALAETRLPITAHRLGPFRSIERRLTGRPQWLALEHMLQREVDAGALTHMVATGGCWLHVATAADMARAIELNVVRRIEVGAIPSSQFGYDDFVPETWS
jgi:hypothetical protein